MPNSDNLVLFLLFPDATFEQHPWIINEKARFSSFPPSLKFDMFKLLTRIFGQLTKSSSNGWDEGVQEMGEEEKPTYLEDVAKLEGLLEKCALCLSNPVEAYKHSMNCCAANRDAGLSYQNEWINHDSEGKDAVKLRKLCQDVLQYLEKVKKIPGIEQYLPHLEDMQGNTQTRINILNEIATSNEDFERAMAEGHGHYQKRVTEKGSSFSFGFSH